MDVQKTGAFLAALRREKGWTQEQEEENMKAVLESSFSLREKMEFFKRKWRRDHRFDDIMAVAGILGVYLAGYHFHNGLRAAALLLPIFYNAIRNNRMMAYVEPHVFDGTEH